MKLFLNLLSITLFLLIFNQVRGLGRKMSKSNEPSTTPANIKFPYGIMCTTINQWHNNKPEQSMSCCKKANATCKQMTKDGKKYRNCVTRNHDERTAFKNCCISSSSNWDKARVSEGEDCDS